MNLEIVYYQVNQAHAPHPEPGKRSGNQCAHNFGVLLVPVTAHTRSTPISPPLGEFLQSGSRSSMSSSSFCPAFTLLLGSEHIAQQIAVEDHAAQHGLLKVFRRRARCRAGHGGELWALFRSLKRSYLRGRPSVQSPADQRFDVLGYIVAFIHELGVGLNQSDELGPVHLRLSGSCWEYWAMRAMM